MSVKAWLKTPETITEPRWWWLTIMATMALSIVDSVRDLVG